MSSATPTAIVAAMPNLGMIYDLMRWLSTANPAKLAELRGLAASLIRDAASVFDAPGNLRPFVERVLQFVVVLASITESPADDRVAESIRRILTGSVLDAIVAIVERGLVRSGSTWAVATADELGVTPTGTTTAEATAFAAAGVPPALIAAIVELILSILRGYLAARNAE